MDEPDVPSFADLLRLEQIERHLFRGTCHAGAPLRAFGGQVAAQSLIAAGSTVDPERSVHSLHGYFLRPGRTEKPIVYVVDRSRDGSSFTTRRVTAMQNGEAIMVLAASFQRSEVGGEHQRDMPEAPAPDTLTDIWASILSEQGRAVRPSEIQLVLDMRYVGDPAASLKDEGRGPHQQLWVRSREKLPDDPLLHACALTYISDLNLARTADLPHQDNPGRLRMASLDHAVWFHRPFRADEWLLFDQESPTAQSGRGLGRGEFYTADGRLVASVMQEVLIRRTTPPTPPR